MALRVTARFRLRDRFQMWLLERVMDVTWRFFPSFYQRVGQRLFAVAEAVGAVCKARGGHRAKDVPDRWDEVAGKRKRFCQDCGQILKPTDPISSLEAFYDFTEVQ